MDAILLKLLITGIIIINVINFVLFGWDKRQSRQNKRRIRERLFFILGIIGGSLGGMAGYVCV